MYSQDFGIGVSVGSVAPSVSASQASETSPKIIVIDQSRTIIETSANAQTMLEEGSVIYRSFDRLTTSTSTNAARLDTAIAKAALYGQSSSSLEGKSGRIDAEMIAVSGGTNGAPHIVIILRSANDERHQRLSEAQRLFGLTCAESRLLAALFEGCSVPQAAQRRGVAKTTARTHLQRVFDKTGARRQGDLMRLVAYA